MTFAGANARQRVSMRISCPPLEGSRRAKLAQGSTRSGGVGGRSLPIHPCSRGEVTPPRLAFRFARASRPHGRALLVWTPPGEAKRRRQHLLCQLCPNLRSLIHSALTLRTGLGAGPPDACFSERKRGVACDF